jgi:phosphatidylcholine synthase
MHAALIGAWQQMFLWLGLALIVDAIDGPLARKIDIETVLPRFSGSRLDLIVDYATYVFVPAFALIQSELVPEWSKLFLAAAILLSSLFHFADSQSKTAEGYFVGFPALWNVVLLYLFVLGLPPLAAAAVVCLLVGLTFVPTLWLHPLRVVRLRPLTLAVVALWSGAAIATLFFAFPSPPVLQGVLVLTGLYIVGVGGFRLARNHG